MNRVRALAEYVPIATFAWLAHWLPRRWALSLGRGAGRLAFRSGARRVFRSVVSSWRSRRNSKTGRTFVSTSASLRRPTRECMTAKRRKFTTRPPTAAIA